jgi:hypothetical protein
MRRSGQAKDDCDGDPYENERSQYPEQERGLADRKPWQFRAIQEEPRSPEDLAMIVVLGDLPADGAFRIVGASPSSVEIGGVLPRVRSGHGSSVAPLARLQSSAVRKER